VVIVVAHRPSALAAVDKIAAMANGKIQAIGPKSEVIAKVSGRKGQNAGGEASGQKAAVQPGPFSANPSISGIPAIRRPSLQFGGQI
jgi:ABC-type sulfate/molybdate transport systems ATPase subunit